jgi:hypothetical protein
MTDLLLRRAQPGRAGAQGDDDYDVIDDGGLVIGRIFKATTSPAGTPCGCGRSRSATMRTARRPTVMSRRAKPLWRHSLRASGGNESKLSRHHDRMTTKPTARTAAKTLLALRAASRFRAQAREW